MDITTEGWSGFKKEISSFEVKEKKRYPKMKDKKKHLVVLLFLVSYKYCHDSNPYIPIKDINENCKGISVKQIGRVLKDKLLKEKIIEAEFTKGGYRNGKKIKGVGSYKVALNIQATEKILNYMLKDAFLFSFFIKTMYFKENSLKYMDKILTKTLEIDLDVLKTQAQVFHKPHNWKKEFTELKKNSYYQYLCFPPTFAEIITNKEFNENFKIFRKEYPMWDAALVRHLIGSCLLVDYLMGKILPKNGKTDLYQMERDILDLIVHDTWRGSKPNDKGYYAEQLKKAGYVLVDKPLRGITNKKRIEFEEKAGKQYYEPFRKEWVLKKELEKRNRRQVRRESTLKQ